MAHANPLLTATVAEFLERYPETIPVFMRYRMACVGCAITQFETVAEAIAIYHLNREQFADALSVAIQNNTRQRTILSSEESQ